MKKKFDDYSSIYITVFTQYTGSSMSSMFIKGAWKMM